MWALVLQFSCLCGHKQMLSCFLLVCVSGTEGRHVCLVQFVCWPWPLGWPRFYWQEIGELWWCLYGIVLILRAALTHSQGEFLKGASEFCSNFPWRKNSNSCKSYRSETTSSRVNGVVFSQEISTVMKVLRIFACLNEHWNLKRIFICKSSRVWHRHVITCIRKMVR